MDSVLIRIGNRDGDVEPGSFVIAIRPRAGNNDLRLRYRSPRVSSMRSRVAM
jgi:hypothetical protein